MGDGALAGRADVDRYRVRPTESVDLADHDPRDRSAFDGPRDEAEELTTALNERLEALQELLWADGSQRVLVVLQAIDAGGKDGTIRKVFDGLNPQGVKVASFKRPTDAELAHDFLWRVHPHVPGDGEMAVFNRSHYEDVLVVRVAELVPETRWRGRYEHIRAFERLLVDEGTTIVKFFLHISSEEQRERLQERIDRPEKRWKFERGDLAVREQWDDYQTAFADMLAETSTEDAPWYVIPADRKWYRNLVVTQVLVDVLEGLDLSPPPPEDDIADIVVV